MKVPTPTHHLGAAEEEVAARRSAGGGGGEGGGPGNRYTKPATNAISASTATALCNPWRSPTVQESSSDASESLFKGAYVPEAAGLRDMTESTQL